MCLQLGPCGNALERTFAQFLDGATDVVAFSKLPEVFGFAIEYTDPSMNLRSYYPNFVAVDGSGIHWLLLRPSNKRSFEISQHNDSPLQPL
jgi:hypothetical protein